MTNMEPDGTYPLQGTIVCTHRYCSVAAFVPRRHSPLHASLACSLVLTLVHRLHSGSGIDPSSENSLARVAHSGVVE